MTTQGIPALPARLAERYDPGPVLGRGVGSVVFRAHDTLLGRDAAVKSFRVAADPRADRELALLARLDHPALVPVFDVEESDGRAFVVMALLEGGSLAARIAGPGPPLGLGVALRTAATVADALEHVHRAGVLHRAVRPANVLFDGDGRAHLADFGVALVADAPRLTGGDTAGGALAVGAAPYLAPEQVRGEDAGPTADVYALGLVLIESLTGRRAFPGDPLDAARARLERRPALPDGLPRPVSALLRDMTAAEPADRPDAAAASAALRRALVDVDPVPATVPVTRTAPAAGAPAAGAAASRPLAARRTGPDVPRHRRVVGTRGIAVVTGLLASAVLAGTVVAASTWPVAETSGDPGTAVVAAGPTPGAPTHGGPASGAARDDAGGATPRSDGADGAATPTGAAARDDAVGAEGADAVTDGRPATAERSDDRRLVADRPAPSSSDPTSSRPTATDTPTATGTPATTTRTTSPEPPATSVPGGGTTDAPGTDVAEAGSTAATTSPTRPGLVPGVLRGVGGLLGGVTGSG